MWIRDTLEQIDVAKLLIQKYDKVRLSHGFHSCMRTDYATFLRRFTLREASPRCGLPWAPAKSPAFSEWKGEAPDHSPS